MSRPKIHLIILAVAVCAASAKQHNNNNKVLQVLRLFNEKIARFVAGFL